MVHCNSTELTWIKKTVVTGQQRPPDAPESDLGQRCPPFQAGSVAIPASRMGRRIAVRLERAVSDGGINQ